MRAIAGIAGSRRKTLHQCSAPNPVMHRNCAHT